MASCLASTVTGVTTPFASYVCAVTQFLSSADLCHLDRVSRTDHAALDALWRLCECKCKGQLPIQELRRGQGPFDTQCHWSHGDDFRTLNPRDTAYLWSVAYRSLLHWTESFSKDSGWHCASFLLQPHPCLQCDATNSHHGSEYVVEPRRRHYLHVSSEEQLTCLRLHHLWLEATGIPLLVRDDKSGVAVSSDSRYGSQFEVESKITPTPRTLAATVLRLLICLGPHLAYVYIGDMSCVDPFVQLWIELGVMPRIPLCMPMYTSDTHKQLCDKWHTLVEFIDG